jgi:hypothetical protein
MFPVISYNPELRQEYCRRVWNVTIREDWTAINYWGREIKSASNIVFSNGVTYKLYVLSIKSLNLNCKIKSFLIHGTTVVH